MKKSLANICLLSASFLIAQSSSAQIYTPPINFTPQIGARIVEPQLDAQRRRSQSGDDDSYQSHDHDEPRALQATLTYSPSKSRTRTNLQNFVNKSRAADPAGAARMEQLFGSTDIMAQISGIMAQYGLSSSNAADAYAVYWVAAWSAVNGRMDDPSASTYQAVSAQAARGLSQSPDFANANDAQKQEMAEALLIQAAMIDAHKASAAGNASQLKAVGDAVAKGADASGLKLYEMTLTEDGFVPAKGRKRSDASDAVEGEEKALASATPAEGKAEGSPNYALMAGAGGLGLGLAFLIGKAMGKKG